MSDTSLLDVLKNRGGDAIADDFMLLDDAREAASVSAISASVASLTTVPLDVAARHVEHMLAAIRENPDLLPGERHLLPGERNKWFTETDD